MKGGYLQQAWLVILLAVLFGGALAAVQTVLGERIEANKRDETISQIPVLVPGASSAEASVIANRVVYRASDGEKQVGWVIQAAGQGFADQIELLVGLDLEMNRLTGLYVLAQKETPGLGNKIVEDGWRSQFGGRPTSGALVVTKEEPSSDGQIRAVTGATISSDSVCEIVNRAVAEVQAELRGGGQGNGN